MQTKNKRLAVLVREVDALTRLGRGGVPQLSELLEGEADQRIAAVLDIHPEGRQMVVDALSLERRGKVLDLVSNHTLRSIVGKFSDYELVQIIEGAPSGVAQKVINTVERSRLGRLVPKIVDETRRQLLLHSVNYPHRSVGRIMQTELLLVSTRDTVDKALAEIEGFDAVNGPIYQVYVVDEDDTFMGTIPIAELIKAPHQKHLRDLYIHTPPLIRSTTTQQRAAQLFQEYDLIEAPVLAKGKLVGRLLVDDILDVIQQEFTEDVQKFAGITGADETMQTPVLTSSRKRLPWMIANIFLDLIAVSIIMPFEETIAVITALAVLMPVVSDMGGNVGIQALSVSVRALAHNRPDWKLLRRELAKEIRVGMLNGLILGAIVGAVALIWWQNPALGLVTMTALFLNTIVASIIGGILPIILRKLNKDPAMMSGAILTTITDFFGFLLFLGLARMFMDYLV